MVRILNVTITTPPNQVADQLRLIGDGFSREVFTTYFRYVPDAQLIVSPDYPLGDALVGLFHGSDNEGNLYPETIEHLRDVTEILAAHGFRRYQPLADAISPVLDRYCLDISAYDVFIIKRAVRQAAEIMDESAALCPFHPVIGQIVEVEKRCRNIAVVRLIVDTPIEYEPGQYLSINTDYSGGRWTNLSPSIPCNDAGQIEFHVHAPSLLSTARQGDRIRIAAAGGGYNLDYDQDMLLIAHGTGLAEARAIIVDMLMKGRTPHTHLFLSADYPGELYELQGLWQLASTAPWLFIQPVVTHESDAWWVGATESSQAPRGLHLTQVGDVGDVVSSFGTWLGHQIIITGPKKLVARTKKKLLTRGTPEELIQTQSYQSAYFI